MDEKWPRVIRDVMSACLQTHAQDRPDMMSVHQTLNQYLQALIAAEQKENTDNTAVDMKALLSATSSSAPGSASVSSSSFVPAAPGGTEMVPPPGIGYSQPPSYDAPAVAMAGGGYSQPPSYDAPAAGATASATANDSTYSSPYVVVSSNPPP
jgi:hypothetical protein